MSAYSVEELRSRLQSDLRDAMRNQARNEIAVLRTLLAEIDNAQAVPVGDLHERYSVRNFGDGSAEVPRRSITYAQLQERFCGDHDERLAAAAQLETIGQVGEAKRLRNEAQIVKRYIAIE
ncbi:MAG TPA: hypothetical protein VHS33_07015 [Sphingomicrobium sp.]|nr:hypothetical protein [Sphingomicrobium sp.]